MLGPDPESSGRGPAAAGARAPRASKHRVSWADAYDEAQYATDGSEPVPTGVAPHERHVPLEDDQPR
eukprot:5514571-Alexandrium_andersonii.AAC.1